MTSFSTFSVSNVLAAAVDEEGSDGEGDRLDEGGGGRDLQLQPDVHLLVG